MTIGKRIMQHRKQLGLTQDQLAEKLGVTAQAVSKWENDQSCPDISTLPVLADIFGTSVDALLGRQEPVYQAEVVEEEDDSREPEGFHFQGNNLEFHFDKPKLGALGLGVYVLAVGILALVSALLSFDLSLWDIAWPTALLVFGVFSMLRRYSFFSMICLLLGAGFLADGFFDLQWQLDSSLIWAIVIVILGISLLVDALRRSSRKNGHTIRLGRGNHNKSQSDLQIDEDSFSYDGSFGENTQYICMAILNDGDISCSFGEYTIDLSEVQAVSAQCHIDANCSFGELTLLVPRRFAVKPVSSTSFAEFSVSGQPQELPEGVIHLDANCSFGEIEVKYI